MSDWTVLHGAAEWWLRELPAASVDAVVADPPYGIGFMGHEWDQPGYHGRRNGEPASGRFGRSSAIVAGRYDLSLSGQQLFQAWCTTWASECLRVLKPGGHLLAFGAPRSYHRLAAGVEDAGLEVRDTIAWLFGEGMPKSLNVAKAFDRAAGHDTGPGWAPVSDDAKAWAGWGTHLKPGYEPIVVARKPLAGRSVTRNVLAHGTGAIHIDAARVPTATGDERHDFNRGESPIPYEPHDAGRWPANVAIDDLAAGELDEHSGVLSSGANPKRRRADKFPAVYGDFAGQEECTPCRGAEIGGASRFYYCAKTSSSERNAGLDGFEGKSLLWSSGEQSPGTFQSAGPAVHRNSHPTVKPIDLMRWLIRLVTPPAGIVLDPFTASGTTGCAAVLEGREFVGIERKPEYVAIAEARIAWWQARPDGPTYRPRRPAPTGQTSIFELLDPAEAVA